MKALRKLIFGETWLLPAGIALMLLVAGLVLKPLMGASWADYGAAILLIWVVGLLVIALRRG